MHRYHTWAWGRRPGGYERPSVRGGEWVLTPQGRGEEENFAGGGGIGGVKRQNFLLAAKDGLKFAIFAGFSTNFLLVIFGRLRRPGGVHQYN